MSLTLAPAELNNLHICANDPGRSLFGKESIRSSFDQITASYLTVNQTFNKRLSATRPRSSTRPRTVVSIFPPHSGMTTLERNIAVLEYEPAHEFTFCLSILVVNLGEQRQDLLHRLLNSTRSKQ